MKNHPLREQLKDVATAAGCEFRYEKKYSDFLSWFQGRRETVLLLADWREAKPIQEQLSKRSESCDVRMNVVAQWDKTFHRASTWASMQPAASNIVVSSGTWLEAAKELVLHQQETSFPGRAAQNLHSPLFMDPHKTFSCVSLPVLVKAVQDPKLAAELERIIRQTMWQTYED